MQPLRDRSRRIKLAIAAVTLTVVFIYAAIQQRKFAAAANAAETPATSVERSRAGERPVFGQPPSPISEDPTPVSRSEAEKASPPAGQIQDDASKRPGDVPAAVLGVLERWRVTLARGDMEGHLETYAPRLERFFNKRGVSRDQVRAEKKSFVSRYPEVNKYEIRDVKVESSEANRVVLSLRKDWDMSSPADRSFAGSERQRLTLARSGDTWRIVGEEETKVYWVRRR